MGKEKCNCDSLEKENAKLKEQLDQLKRLEFLTWQREDLENKASRSTGEDKKAYSKQLEGAIDSEKSFRKTLRKEGIID